MHVEHKQLNSVVYLQQENYSRSWNLNWKRICQAMNTVLEKCENYCQFIVYSEAFSFFILCLFVCFLKMIPNNYFYKTSERFFPCWTETKKQLLALSIINLPANQRTTRSYIFSVRGGFQKATSSCRTISGVHTRLMYFWQHVSMKKHLQPAN